MTIRFLFFIIITSISANSQSQFHSNGFQVTMGDIEQRTFDKDSTANALVIYEIGDSYVDMNGFKLKTEVRKKIKVFNKDGIEKAAKHIYLSQRKKGKKEKIKKIDARVYYIDSEELAYKQLDYEILSEEKENEQYKVVKFDSRNIQAGSVLTFSYTIESSFMDKYKGWCFQSDIPKLYSEYKASIPGNWDYHINIVGDQKLFIKELKTVDRCFKSSSEAYSNCGIYRYAMKDIPAFINESYMTTKLNYLARVEYELNVFKDFNGNINNISQTWEDFDNEINFTFDIGQELKNLNITKDLIQDNELEPLNELDKAKFIFQYVQQNYTWNETYKLFTNVSLNNTINEGSGSAAEINLVLHNLLKNHNIKVSPIIASTRSNGFITQLYPELSDFNYMMVKAEINNQTYFLDATDKYVVFGQIPFRCLNRYGRVLNNKGISSWISIKPEILSTQSFRGEINISNDLHVNGKFDYKTTGYPAVESKRAINNSDAFVKKIGNSDLNLNISDVNITPIENTDNEFNASFLVDYDLETNGDVLSLNPYLFPFFTDNPFKLQERSYPVDFGYKESYVYMLNLTIDEDITISKIPEKSNVSLPNRAASLTSNYLVNGNQILIIFKLTFNEAVYDSSYYPFLKEIMNKSVDVQKYSTIVLKKKA